MEASKRTPFLIMSDAPTSGTGLGRVTRDLASRMNRHLSDVFEVATLGYGGPQHRSLGFPQYNMEMRDWIVYNLPDVWEDFAGDRKGVLLTVWDASRLLWLARPENCSDASLRKFLKDSSFALHGYFPMDATGPNDKLTAILGHTIDAYDRVLAYSKWAADILERTLKQPVEHIPHGIDTSVFYPRHFRSARNGFGERLGARTQKGKWMTIPYDATLIGIVATNQTRKDYGVALQAIAEYKRDKQVILWIHTDELERHWSIPALIYDYGFEHDECVVTCNLGYTDEQMAWAYSACDFTLGIGNGEGFGYPIFESLACGTPCIHGNYGGAAEHMQPDMLVEPVAERIEGCYNTVRKVYNPSDWYAKLKFLARKDGKSLLPAHLDWNNLWPVWESWLRKGATDADNSISSAVLRKDAAVAGRGNSLERG